MRKIVLALAVVLTTNLAASDLVVKADHHYVSRAGDLTPMAAVFVDERLIATVKLDVYSVPEIPSTKRYHEELSALTPDSWLTAMRWSLLDADGRDVKLQRPVALRSTVRSRGPNAARASDRDTTVACTTYEARLDFGPLSPGDYTLVATVHGLRSAFPLSVRTGQERDVREKFLEVKASRATTYAEFRALQLERHRVNPSRLDPLFEVIDRALLESTIEDTKELFAVALAKMDERRQKAQEPEKARFFTQRVRELRETERALPEYFARRHEWQMVRDFARGSYVIKDRKAGTVVKDFGQKPVAQ